MPASYRFFLGYSRCNYPFAERLKADLDWARIGIFCVTTDCDLLFRLATAKDQ